MDAQDADSGAGGAQGTLLLVEDDFIVARAEQRTLEKYGYEVLHARTGERAVETVQSGPEPDLVLMDIDLGSGIDGIEAAGRILQCIDLPIVFLSALTDENTKEQARGVESYGYVPKGCDPDTLHAAIQRALCSAAGGAPPVP